MSYYSDDELLRAVRNEMNNNSDFRRELSEAVERKNKSWIRRLVEWVAQTIFGSFIGSIISAVVRFFWKE